MTRLLLPTRASRHALTRVPWRALARAAWLAPLGLAALVLASIVLRSGELGIGFWIDEGLSVGIAGHRPAEIPATLRLDGSPPLYYLLLHGWMAAFGEGEVATRRLSLLFACLCIPVAWWLMRNTFSTRAAWAAAVLVAFNPFLTRYAQETRMYSLVVLLGLVATIAFVQVFVAGRRGGWRVAFALSLTALLYTHNWALFLGAGLGLTWLGLLARATGPARREQLRAGVSCFGVVALLYLPWVPTMLFQAAHTGAPWALAPGPADLGAVPGRLLGVVPGLLLLLAAGAGLVAVLRTGRGAEEAEDESAPAAGVRCALTDQSDPSRLARSIRVLIAIEVLTLLLAWLSSQVAPAWALRYLAVAVAPLLVLAAVGISRAGGIGWAGLALVAVVSALEGPPTDKSNVRALAAVIRPGLAPGDLVVSTQPEQVPVLDYYLPDGIRYAALWGELSDPTVTDWRDGVERMAATSPRRDLIPLVRKLEPGQKLVLVEPIIYDRASWSAPWTELVRFKSLAWRGALLARAELQVAARYPASSYPARPNPLSATVFVRVARP